jgi:hypothetical protein
MVDDADGLREILARFAHDPDNASIWPAARELADRFTLDQLCAMAAPRAAEVRRLFDRILGRTTRYIDPPPSRPASDPGGIISSGARGLSRSSPRIILPSARSNRVDGT